MVLQKSALLCIWYHPQCWWCDNEYAAFYRLRKNKSVERFMGQINADWNAYSLCVVLPKNHSFLVSLCFAVVSLSFFFAFTKMVLHRRTILPFSVCWNEISVSNERVRFVYVHSNGFIVCFDLFVFSFWLDWCNIVYAFLSKLWNWSWNGVETNYSKGNKQTAIAQQYCITLE